MFTLTPKDGGAVMVSITKGTGKTAKTYEVEVSAEDVEREAAKCGLGPPTPHTPVHTDRVTA